MQIAEYDNNKDLVSNSQLNILDDICDCHFIIRLTKEEFEFIVNNGWAIESINENKEEIYEISLSLQATKVKEERLTSGKNEK